MRFCRVRNWDKFQHYKDRNPPWVKLYTSWADDYEWAQWDDASKLLAVCAVMLAGKTGNRIPLDPKWIQQRCSLTKVPDLSALIAVGFLEEIQALRDTEQIASSVLADCKQDASDPLAFARSREERRGETEKTDQRARARGHRCPPEFILDLEFARTEIADIDAEEESARFKDYEFQKRRSDWAAVWRNWVRKCKETGRYAHRQSNVMIFAGKPVEWS